MNNDENGEPEWTTLEQSNLSHPIQVREMDDTDDLRELRKELESALEHVEEEIQHRDERRQEMVVEGGKA